MSKSPSPESSSHTFLKFLALGFPLLVLAGLIACGGSSVTHLSTGGGGGGGGGSRTVNDMLFAADFNKIASNPKGWCPTDSAGNVAAVTTLRIWDSGIKWANIETAPGVYDWSKMDQTVTVLAPNTTRAMSVIYTFGNTPLPADVAAPEDGRTPARSPSVLAPAGFAPAGARAAAGLAGCAASSLGCGTFGVLDPLIQ